MNRQDWRNAYSKHGIGQPNFLNAGPKRNKRENKRFGSNKGKNRGNALVIDAHMQEETPEHLRIEIDNIFKQFLEDSTKEVYIFPPDFNNIQRKYIHYKAQIMNLVSKSHGREPNRQLHLKKKPRQVASKSIQINCSEEILKELQDFAQKYEEVQFQFQQHKTIKKNEKIFSKLEESKPIIPKNTQASDEILSIRRSLPIFEKKEVVMESINKNQVIIISSETGSGKTTQIPQYILEEAFSNSIPCKVICTQPRRISTIAAAERVAYERGESVGGSVGYHIRLESKYSAITSLLYCTVGVFLRNLMNGNKCLKNISHVIVDEIHERDKLSDFLLICLKQNLPLFPNLKVILMSATVDTTKFQEYFNASTVLSIPGRLFPIESYFIEQVLGMTQYFSPHMRQMKAKLERKQQEASYGASDSAPMVVLPEEDQDALNLALEAYLNFSDNYDYTIHYAEATADLLQLFISEDVPVDQQHSERGWTALMIACQLGDLEFIGKLCNMGASFDVADKLGKTAYEYASRSNTNGIVQLLDYFKQQRTQEKQDDPHFLGKLYDMTTPEDYIDYDLIVSLIKYINENSDFGSILVFLPGYDEIMQCNDHILDSDLDSTKYRIFFLHSSMNMRDQCDVFKKLVGQRKIVLSTNIAETSITIEDVVFVIDVGKAKEKSFDSYNKLSALQTQWISRACAKQREGRAGRCRPGFCFRLYSEQRFTHMAEERVPEILRVSLEELCLHAKIIAPKSMNIYNFLNLAPDPPTANSVGVAIENLQSLGALDKEEDLTRLGEYLAQLTLEPRLGKMLIYGCIFRCLEPMLTLAAGMAHKDPFQLPAQASLRSAAAAKRREIIGDIPSDHVVYLNVFQRWQEEATRGYSKKFCMDYFISESTMNSVLETRRQLLAQLRSVGFVNSNLEDFNTNSNSWALVKAIMSSAFFPNIAHPVQGGLALSTRSEKKVAIHNTSVCQTKKYQYWCFYDEMVKNRTNFFIRGVTFFTPLSVALMCGVDTISTSSHSISIDEWLDFYFGDTLSILLRTAIQKLIENALYNPVNSFDKLNELVSEALSKILDLQERDCQLNQPKNVGSRPKFLYKLDQKQERHTSKNTVISRRDMVQRTNRPNGFYPGCHNQMNRNIPVSGILSHPLSRNDYVEDHKKGRTPKRYVPPHRRYGPPNHSSAIKSLKFDSTRASTNTTASEIANSFQNINLGPGTSNFNPAETLLKGLEVPFDYTNTGSCTYYNKSFYGPSSSYGPRSYFDNNSYSSYNSYNSFEPFVEHSEAGGTFQNSGRYRKPRKKY